MALLTLSDLRVYFHTRDGIIKAVDGISYDLNEGETLGIVGESGSGKSVSCYSMLGLIPMPPGRIESGTAFFNNRDLLALPAKELQKIRGNEIAMIFQDPMTCLNPYMTIGAQLMEPLLIHKKTDKSGAYKKALIMLDEVGIQDGEKRMKQFPHEFSGGMRQRVMIAMALIAEPKLLIADEPTTALDVTIQAQIIELIKRLQKRHNTAVLFITHDLGVIASVADRIIVMYGGRIMENAISNSIYMTPQHPYTAGLIRSIPAVHKPGEALYTINGQPPDMSQKINSCLFAPRCAHRTSACDVAIPKLMRVNNDHWSSCCRVQNGELSQKELYNG